MYCGKCGSPIDEGVKFCRSCGAPIRIAPEDPLLSGASLTLDTQPEAVRPAGSDSVQASSLINQAVSQVAQEKAALQASASGANGFIRQAEASNAAHDALVAQMTEVVARYRRGEVTPEVFESAKRLAVSQSGGEDIAGIAVIEYAKRTVPQATGYDPSLNPAAEQAWITSTFPNGKRILYEAQLSALEERRARGEVSDVVYSMRMSELSNTRRAIEEEERRNSSDPGSGWWAVVGFLAPVVGLILYIVWRKDKPRSASIAGKGAIAGAVTIVVVYLIYFLVIMGMLSSLSQVPAHR